MMKRPLLLLLCVFCAGLRLDAQYRDPVLQSLYDSDASGRMRADVGYYSSRALEGRKAGSDGEKDAAQYLSKRFS